MNRSIAILMIVVPGFFGASQACANALQELREEHWFEAMRIAQVDSEVLYGIALMESGTSFNGMRSFGPWPWVMNINEKPKFYSSREAARESLSKEVAEGNKQIAVGMWQIHLRYNSHYVDDPLDLVDPVTNLYVAAMVLRECGSRYGTLRDILSCYHSGDVDRAGIDYAERVIKLSDTWGKPFRVSQLPTEVRFVHRDMDATTDAIVAASEGASVMEESGSESTLTEDREEAGEPSITMLAALHQPLKVQSHKQFLQILSTQTSESTRRVVVVE